MKAFHTNIDALEQKIELLIQKWNRALEENLELKEKNKKLEEELKFKNSEKEFLSESDKKIAFDNIEQVLDGYIKEIDSCLELINIELDGR